MRANVPKLELAKPAQPARVHPLWGALFALGAWSVGCADDDEQRDASSWGDEILLAQEQGVVMTPSPLLRDEQPIDTSLPVQLSNGLTLQGCKGTKVSTSASDPTQLEINFLSGFRLSLWPDESMATTDCQIHINVTGASNMKFVTTSVFYNGAVDMRTDGLFMTFQSEMYWQSKILQLDELHKTYGSKAEIVRGPRTGGWTLDHALGFENATWGESECLGARSDSDQLVLNTRLRLEAKRPSSEPAAARLTLIRATATGFSDAADASAPAKFGLRVKAVPCTPGAP